MLHDRRFAILGAGTMGQAVARGLIDRAGVAPAQIAASVKHAERAEAVQAALGIRATTINADAVRDADVVILGTKPKDALLAIASAGDALDPRPLVISIAAGITIARLEQALRPGTPVIRAMPNTPCLVGAGMTVLSPGTAATAAHMEIAKGVFSALGRVRALDEEHLDAVTGLSGSGPAFVYVMIEALSEGGVMMGLPRAVALELAAQTMAGAAQMVLETGRHPASLKDDVTTPAGCTVAGLLEMEDGKVRSVLARTVQVATLAASGLGKPKPAMG